MPHNLYLYLPCTVFSISVTPHTIETIQIAKVDKPSYSFRLYYFIFFFKFLLAINSAFQNINPESIMCTRGEWQLKSINIRFSETSMKSLGMRFFLQHLLPRWKSRNPQIKIHVVHHEYLIPQCTFYFGET